MSAVVVDEALQRSLGRLLRSVYYTSQTWQLRLVHLRQGCVRVSVRVTLRGRLLLFECYICSSRHVWYAVLPKLQAYTSTSLSACVKKKFPLPTVIYSVVCFRRVSFSLLGSFIIWTCRDHCVLNEKLTSYSKHYSYLLRLGLRAWFNSVEA